LNITTNRIDYISLEPLSPANALEILKSKFNRDFKDDMPKALLELLESRDFFILLGDIGVVPKFLLWLYLAIKVEMMTLLQNTTNVERKVFQFAKILNDEVSMSTLLEKLYNNKKEIYRFLSDCIFHSEVTWTSQYNGFTIETLAKHGNIFIKSISPSSLSLFFPCILLNSFLKGLKHFDYSFNFNFKELETLASCPFDDKSWNIQFEDIIMRFVLVKFNVTVLSGNRFLLFQSLFPSYLGKVGKYQLYIHMKNEGKLQYDTKKWIDINENKLVFNQVLMSEGSYICCKGNKNFDGRICCETEDKKKVLIAIQIRKTDDDDDDDEMSMITYDELKRSRDILLSKYKKFDIIIVGGITNSHLSQHEKQKFENVENIFCISQSELNSFTLNLNYRFQ
jgi:hypothetical protein